MPRSDDQRREQAKAARNSPKKNPGGPPARATKHRLALTAAVTIVVVIAYFVVCVIFDDYHHTYAHRFSEDYAGQPAAGILRWLVLKINDEHIGDWEFMQILGGIQYGLLATGVTWWWTRPARPTAR